MKKFQGYIKSAIYNIKHNKAYASFVVFGTALTFIFITIVLQITNEIVNNVPPFVNADREIYIGQYNLFKDKKGSNVHGIYHKEIPMFLKNIKNYEFCALKGHQLGGISVDNRLTSSIELKVVNGDYWKINEFNFIKGRPFTEEEVVTKTKVAVISKHFAETNFKTEDVLGKELEFQEITYTIIGVIDGYSSLINNYEGNIWIPHTFNSFIPDSNPYYELYTSPNKDVTISEFKDEIARALEFYYRNKSIDIDINNNDILTRKEVRIENFGDNKLSYGISIVLLLLLIIPSVNIVVISIANINNRAREIAVRRSMGATILSSFVLIMIENLLLVILGIIIGVTLVFPMADLIGSLFFNELTIISNNDILLPILAILPLSLLFTLLSGGIPAYLIAKGKISKILKEDFSKNGNSIKRFFGIFIEQILIFIILMLAIVSISVAVDKYNEPGLLNTDNVVNFGYSAIDYRADNLDEVSRNMDILQENLKKSSNVIALSVDYMVVPYIRGANDETDSITIDNTKIKSYVKWSGKSGRDIYDLELVEGDWFTNEKLPDGTLQVVITKDIADSLKWNKSVGKKLSVRNREYTIVGVIAGFRHVIFQKSTTPTVIMPYEINEDMNMFREVSIKVKDIDVFTADFYSQWNKLMKNRGVTMFYWNLNDLKEGNMTNVTADIILQTIPTIFLLIFAFIGTFGIFWLTSKKRVKEFALRMAIGSTTKGLTWLVIKESIIITSISMIPGLIMAVFIYELTMVHFVAIGITVVFMLLFAIFSAWYPAYTVSKINPAKALKDE